MKNEHNYPMANAKTIVSANPGTQNIKATKTVGATDHRGNAASKAGPNYSGGSGTGIVQAKKGK